MNETEQRMLSFNELEAMALCNALNWAALDRERSMAMAGEEAYAGQHAVVAKRYRDLADRVAEGFNLGPIFKGNR